MTGQEVAAGATTTTPAWRYLTPFVAFMVLLLASESIPLAPVWELPARFVVLAVICVLCWPRDISLRARAPLWTALVGAVIFVIWVAPEFLNPGYRSMPLFSNSIVGHVHSSLPPVALLSPWVLAWRTARAVLIVPIVEELFWRGWLMRFLIDRDFSRVPLGKFAPGAFWITAVLFASEHGPYWDVGLIAGIAYNGLLVRTKSLADCILAHAITNGLLSWYVIATSQWQYWQ
jgi:CAAX prenyl protease-like protein